MSLYLEPTDDEEAAELLGRLAALRKITAASNPFRDRNSPLTLAWSLGWTDERARFERDREARTAARRLENGATIEEALAPRRRRQRQR